MRKFLFILAVQISYYLVCVFLAFDWMFFTETAYRVFFMVFELVLAGLTGGFIDGFGNGTPKFLIAKTHDEKKYGIKKYIGELHEELRLYGEAMDLQNRINEFKRK